MPRRSSLYALLLLTLHLLAVGSGALRASTPDDAHCGTAAAVQPHAGHDASHDPPAAPAGHHDPDGRCTMPYMAGCASGASCTPVVVEAPAVAGARRVLAQRVASPAGQPPHSPPVAPELPPPRG